MVLDLLGEDTLFKQSDVRETPSATVELAAQLSPIGSVVAWLKTYTNTPALAAGWVECDGTAINDADSVYNGQNSPDLNGGIFLEGQTTSGATGGTANKQFLHTHKLISAGGLSNKQDGTTVGWNADEDTLRVSDGAGGGDFDEAENLTDQPTNTFDNRPPFYTVVWIMRIK